MPAFAEPLRVATFNTELTREGPGLLLRDALRGDAQVLAVAQVIAKSAPDVILLQGVDYDVEQLAVKALRDRISTAGHFLPHIVAFPPNSGVPTGLDLDGDGYTDGAADAQGFGRFAGQGGMVLLSRFPVIEAQDYSGLLWADQAWADRHAISQAWGAAASILRLASVGAWRVRVDAPSGPVNLLAFHACPPVFDGPEDRNGLRNRDQLLFWAHLLDSIPEPVVVLGDANNDPQAGEGRKEGINALLTHPRLADPLAGHPTVDWSALGLGLMRVDYVLPDRSLGEQNAGLAPPAPEASRHRLVWVDIEP
ncbi:endonuclease/exonuclease/phosphatase family protein [Thalassobius vesicularis]|uniref:endonuclease/exonuclease/phosphatase family protein n=1 Tax=Thalassobius vesicularis TaxID=1294297 RepID=UPI001454D1F9|nr:endonuclease/exonuclease/phosphatase family protein [Thalassobius vesicularis]